MSARDTTTGLSHLLLVDDDRLILSTVASGLRQVGYQISTAESVDDAQALLSGGVRPDLVILDVHMSDLDGLALAVRLRELDHIPFVMFSAYSDPKTVEAATQLGALGYMVKPLDIFQMVPTLEAALVRASELRSLQDAGVHLQKALDSERDINVAVGITMAQQHLSRDAAFALLRTSSRAQRRKLSDLASDVIATTEVLYPSVSRRHDLEKAAN
jgi:two-component system, response regulator PdtaR